MMENEEKLKENRKKILEDSKSKLEKMFDAMKETLSILEKNIEVLRFTNLVKTYQIKNNFIIGFMITLCSIVKENYLLLFFYITLVSMHFSIKDFFYYQLTNNKWYIGKIIIFVIIAILGIFKTIELL